MSREIVSLYKTKELYTARIYLFAKMILIFLKPILNLTIKEPQKVVG